MTTTNLFARLKRMLPDAPVLLGRVLELHDDDDTSTVQLLYPNSLGAYDGTLSTGATMRARGQTVPVGGNAFVRNGVIETRAPEGEPLDIPVGRVVLPADPLTFSPDVDDLELTPAVPFALDLAGHWHGGVVPLLFTLASGTLPVGLAIDAYTGALSGTPTTPGGPMTVTVRATDAAANPVDSNAFDITVAEPLPATYLVIGRFDSDGTNAGTAGGAFGFSGGAAVDLTFKLFGAGSLICPTNAAQASIGEPELAIAPGTAVAFGGWVYIGGAQTLGSTGGNLFSWITTAHNLFVQCRAGTTSSKVKIALNGDTTLHLSGDVTMNAWHHVWAALSADGATMRLFIDGHLEVTASRGGSTGGTTAFKCWGPSVAISGAQWFDSVGFIRDVEYAADFTPPGAL